MSSLQAFYAGAFQAPSTSTLNQVLVAGNTTSQSIVSTGNISCVDLTSSSDVFASNVSSTGTVTIQKPLLPSYSLLAYPVPAGSVGTSVPVTELSGFPYSMNSAGSWYNLFTSSTVLPLGIYMLNVQIQLNNPGNTTCFTEIGVVNDAVSVEPPAGSYGQIRSAPNCMNFNVCFVSVTGFQTPKFVYNNDTDTVSVSALLWCATKIG